MYWHKVGERRTWVDRFWFGRSLCRKNGEEGRRKTSAELCRNCGLVLFTASKIELTGEYSFVSQDKEQNKSCEATGDKVSG
jgi:hypothetical protein